VLERELPLHSNVWRAEFSPDGRWLATVAEGGGVRLWTVGTWQEGPVLSEGDPSWAFAPDSQTVAVGDQTGVVRLCRTATGQELARLEIADQTRLIPIGFSRDGGRLFAVGLEDGALHVWDLRLIELFREYRREAEKVLSAPP
jgi:WD40 repeat protein